MQKEGVDTAVIVAQPYLQQKYFKLIVEVAGAVMPAAIIIVFVSAGIFLRSSKKPLCSGMRRPLSLSSHVEWPGYKFNAASKPGLSKRPEWSGNMEVIFTKTLI